MPTRALHRLALFARRRYRAIFAVTFVLVAISLVSASRLRLETDVLALLPREDPVVETFRLALEDFGSVDRLLVAVRIPPDVPLEPYEAWVDRLGQRLVDLETFEKVDYRIGELEELLATFLPRSLLFLEEEHFPAVTERLSDEGLRRRAGELRRLVAMPQSLALKGLLKLDPLGLSEILLRQLDISRGGLAIDITSGYILSRDHRMLLILAQPERPPQDVDFSIQLVETVEREIEAVRAEWPEVAGEDGPPAPEVALGGRYVIAIADADIIRRDVLWNIVTSMVGVLLLFLLAFRRFGLLVYAFVPLFCGLALTFGFTAMTFGALSSATSGIAALLIGLGIDFIIVSYGRYVEERRSGATIEDALKTMSGSTGRAVVIGGVTSAATFYSFGVTDFTGLYQMGYLTGTGILFCMVAVLLLLPAMMAWTEDRHARRRRAPRLHLHGFGSARVIRWSLRRPRVVLAAGLVLTLVAGWLALDLRFEDSVQAMRPKGNPGVEVREEISSHFASGFEQMVLLFEADTVEEVLSLASEGAEKAEALVESGILTEVDSVRSLLPAPETQRKALAWLAQGRSDALAPERIRRTFVEALAAQGMRGEAFTRGLDLFTEAVTRDQPLAVADFEASPQTRRLLERYLVPTEDGYRSAVYLHPPAKIWRRQAPPEVEALAASMAPHAVLTGANVLSEFLRERVLDDAVLAAVLGFVLVGLLLWLDYRRIGITLLTLVPLIIGIIWMLGAMAALDLSMNFMNIFVSTMIIGIGVDYGVHMIHRHREISGGDPEAMKEGLIETGKAIVLAALSTIVGFGSLARSHYPGLASMGLVAILGAVSTMLVATTLLPAYLALIRSRKS